MSAELVGSVLLAVLIVLTVTAMALPLHAEVVHHRSARRARAAGEAPAPVRTSWVRMGDIRSPEYATSVGHFAQAVLATASLLNEDAVVGDITLPILLTTMVSELLSPQLRHRGKETWPLTTTLVVIALLLGVVV